MISKLKAVHEYDDEYHFDDNGEIVEPKSRKSIVEPQFLYMGRLVNKRHFRAFVYGNEGVRLAESHKEFEEMVGSGLWFESQEAYDAEKVVEPVAEPEPVKVMTLELKTGKKKPARKPRPKSEKEKVVEPTEDAIEDANEDHNDQESTDSKVIQYG
jgi:hypothetical protein